MGDDQTVSKYPHAVAAGSRYLRNSDLIDICVVRWGQTKAVQLVETACVFVGGMPASLPTQVYRAATTIRRPILDQPANLSRPRGPNQ